MRKVALSIVAVALIAGVATFAITANGVAGATKAPKPPVTATCNSGTAGGVASQFGSESNQLVVGCTGSSTKAKITATGSIVPDVSTSSATIYWTNKKTDTESFSYAAGGTCPTFLGKAATTAVTVTGKFRPSDRAELSVGELPVLRV